MSRAMGPLTEIQIDALRAIGAGTPCKLHHLTVLGLAKRGLIERDMSPPVITEAGRAVLATVSP